MVLLKHCAPDNPLLACPFSFIQKHKHVHVQKGSLPKLHQVLLKSVRSYLNLREIRILTV